MRPRVPASPLTRNSPGLRVDTLDGRLRTRSSPIRAAYLLPGDPQTRTGSEETRPCRATRAAKWRAYPLEGSPNPPMYALTHLVAHGHRRPRSTRWVNLRSRGGAGAGEGTNASPRSPPRRVSASLAALAAANALAGAGRALGGRRTSGAGGAFGGRARRVLAAAAAPRPAIGAAALTGVQRAIPVLGPARPRAARRTTGIAAACGTPATAT